MSTEVQAQERDATHEELVERARKLAPTIRDRAAEIEAGRRIPPDIVDELVDAGFARILTPARFGGLELPLDAWFDVVCEIGRADTSTAWCTALLSHLSHLFAFAPEEAQEALWAGGPDVRVAGSIAPATKVEKVDGGYRLTGKATFASGVDHADWVHVGGFIHDGDRHEVNQFLIPRAEIAIEDTWFSAGMRGTGSKTIVTDGVFVPETHRISIPDLLNATGPGTQFYDNPMYKLPFVMFGGPTFLAPMLGAARSMYDAFVADAGERMVPPGARFADRWSIQETISEAGVQLDVAEMLIRRTLDRARHGAPITDGDRARALRDYSTASETIRGAVEQMMRKGGTRVYMEANPMQRVWRDTAVISSHLAFDHEHNLTYYGKLELGLERDPLMSLF